MADEWGSVFRRFDGFIATLLPSREDVFAALSAAKRAGAARRHRARAERGGRFARHRQLFQGYRGAPFQAADNSYA